VIPSRTGADNQSQSPADLTGSDWKATLRRTVKEFKSDRATLISAGIAFYWFLAIFPALIAAVGIFGLVDAGKEATDTLVKAIRTTLPGGPGGAADVAVPGGRAGALGRSLARNGGGWPGAGAVQRVGGDGGSPERHGRGLRRSPWSVSGST